jgi:hypothetical protein
MLLNLKKKNLQMKFWIAFEEMEAGALASTHLVKYSAATKIIFFCRNTIEKGPSK